MYICICIYIYVPVNFVYTTAHDPTHVYRLRCHYCTSHTGKPSRHRNFSVMETRSHDLTRPPCATRHKRRKSTQLPSPRRFYWSNMPAHVTARRNSPPSSILPLPIYFRDFLFRTAVRSPRLCVGKIVPWSLDVLHVRSLRAFV